MPLTMTLPLSHLPSKNGGAGLIEVLIALLVIGIGILGLVGLQASAKRTGLEAIQRSTAVYLAQDIIERMRNNRDELYNGSYTVLNIGDGSLADPDDCLEADPCTTAQIAAHDLWDWEQRIDGATEGGRGGLVDPRACINFDGAGFVTVAIAWRGYNPGGNPVHPEDVDDCGAGLGLYDDPDPNNVNPNDADAMRQVVVITTFVQ